MTPVSYDGRLSPELSRRASAALSQITPKGPSTAVTLSLAAGAALGVAAGLIPRKDKGLKNAAIGGSLVALAVGGLLLAWGD